MAIQAISISNDLYRYEICSAFELAKDYSKLIKHDQVHLLPEKHHTAQEKLAAKRNLNHIRGSKAVTSDHVTTGASANVFQKRQMEKRGKCLSGRTIPTCDLIASSVRVPRSNGKEITTAIEFVRPAITEDIYAEAVQDNTYTKAVQDGLDNLDDDIATMFDAHLPHRSTRS